MSEKFHYRDEKPMHPVLAWLIRHQVWVVRVLIAIAFFVFGLLTMRAIAKRPIEEVNVVPLTDITATRSEAWEYPEWYIGPDDVYIPADTDQWAAAPEDYDLSDSNPRFANDFEYGDGEPQESEDGTPVYPIVIENVRITHYCPCEICCGQYALGEGYHRGAYGEWLTAYTSCAADPSLFPNGTTIVCDEGIFTVQDTGVRGNHIDIFCEDHKTALRMGTYVTDIWVYPPSEVVEQ